jgi:hypothetical protein
VRDIWRAGDDLKPMLPGIDRRQDQAVRIRMSFHRLDVADVDLVPRIADNRDLLGFQAGHRQPVSKLLHRKTGVDKFREPAKWNFHRFMSLGTRNRARHSEASLPLLAVGSSGRRAVFIG